jgi:TPR repeat protein
MRYLGDFYRDAMGVERDNVVAREWYEKAAAKGDEVAMRYLGDLHRDGMGVEHDYAIARDWYEKAAAKGDAVAMRDLGLLHFNGDGLPQDYALAHDWYEKAAAGGDLAAMRLLGALYENGDGVPRNLAKARDWYEKAAAKGDKAAQKALARLSASEAFERQRYGEAVRLMEAIGQAAEAEELAEQKSIGKATAGANNSLAWYRLFARDFHGALAAAEKALSVSPDSLVYATNKAHALMFLGRIDEARSIYLGHKGESLEGLGSWEAVILKDFQELEAAGVTHPQMLKFKTQLSSTLKLQRK